MIFEMTVRLRHRRGFRSSVDKWHSRRSRGRRQTFSKNLPGRRCKPITTSVTLYVSNGATRRTTNGLRWCYVHCSFSRLFCGCCCCCCSSGIRITCVQQTIGMETRDEGPTQKWLEPDMSRILVMIEDTQLVSYSRGRHPSSHSLSTTRFPAGNLSKAARFFSNSHLDQPFAH